MRIEICAASEEKINRRAPKEDGPFSGRRISFFPGLPFYLVGIFYCVVSFDKREKLSTAINQTLGRTSVRYGEREEGYG